MVPPGILRVDLGVSGARLHRRKRRGDRRVSLLGAQIARRFLFHEHPADLEAIADLIRTTRNLTPKQAIRYTGRGRTAVFEFIRLSPKACTVDADGFRRIAKNWLDAWC